MSHVCLISSYLVVLNLVVLREDGTKRDGEDLLILVVFMNEITKE